MNLIRPMRLLFPMGTRSREISIWNRVTDIFSTKGTSKIRINVAGQRIYENIVDRTDYPKFFLGYQMPNTFNSWFLITELHVWLVLTRVMANTNDDTEHGRMLRNVIVEALWTDANTRAKQLAADNPSAMRAQLQELSQQFQMALIVYDDGLAGSDKVLASALWERFFEKQCHDYTHLEDLVKYVRREIHHYDSCDFKLIVEDPNILWPEGRKNIIWDKKELSQPLV